MSILDRLFGKKKASPTAQPTPPNPRSATKTVQPSQPSAPAVKRPAPRVTPVTPSSLQSLPQVKNSFHVGYAAYGYDWRPLRTRTSSEVMTRIGGLSGWSTFQQGEYVLVSKRGDNLEYEIYRVGENEYVMLKRSSGEEGFSEDA